MAAISKTNLLAILSLSSIFFTGATSDDEPSKITSWCNNTPYPYTCNYYFIDKQNGSESLAEFQNEMIRVSMGQAVAAEKQIQQYINEAQNDRQRSAWADCLKLYGHTINQLNNTIQGCTNFDANTWLSSALTNIKTCEMGFLDLKAMEFANPMMSKNLSELITNSLATNEVLLGTKNETTMESTQLEDPIWVSSDETKLLGSKRLTSRANVVVAKDGSGNLTTIQAAIDMAAGKNRSDWFVIYVKKGVYEEIIQVGTDNSYVLMVGDGMKNTIITASRSVGGGYTTYSSATTGIDGFRFMARDIAFVNSAGPEMEQAVALRSASDLSVFYRCSFQGYQDTLMVHAQRQFFKSCQIYGTIDFIFGNAAVVFQNCKIFVRKPLLGQSNVITAQGRDDPYQNTGISVHNSKILPASDLKRVVKEVKSYLGRPWMRYSRVVFMKTYIDSLISPDGWLPWEHTKAGLDTLYYAEYSNTGPGSSTSSRVKWPGFHVITDPNDASKFTAGTLIAGRAWLPDTGVPLKLGL